MFGVGVDNYSLFNIIALKLTKGRPKVNDLSSMRKKQKKDHNDWQEEKDEPLTEIAAEPAGNRKKSWLEEEDEENKEIENEDADADPTDDYEEDSY